MYFCYVYLEAHKKMNMNTNNTDGSENTKETGIVSTKTQLKTKAKKRPKPKYRLRKKSKKIHKKLRYGKKNPLNIILDTINSVCSSWTIEESIMVNIKNIHDFEKVVLLSEDEILPSDIRLNAIDFYIMHKLLKSGEISFEKFNNTSFCFSTVVYEIPQPKRQALICFEKNENYEKWFYHIRFMEWVKNMEYKIACIRP